ncbi:unnamed protein product [Brassica napus]|uniref:(rape) hypothetical protein n=1 Tax=Brassica napus TaxID=3708 RepID=A0A816JNF9_BRANA|nr:unnamed protein product [Brassica napus]
MATTRQIVEQPQSPLIQRIKSSGTISINGSPMNDDKEEEFSRSSLALFKAKEDEIERRKMEVRDRVQSKLGLAEEATRRLADIREELESLTDPMRKEISAIRKRVDAINRELKPLGQSCQKKEKEFKEALEAYNDKNKEKAMFVSKLVELVTESEKLRMTKLEELSKSIDISGIGAPAGVPAPGFEPWPLRNLHVGCSTRDQKPLHGEPHGDALAASMLCSLRSLVWTTSVGPGYSSERRREEVSAMPVNPSNGGIEEEKMKKKAKVVVIMGPTGSGKSKLAVDLASHFPVEIINADAMQIYSGLDVLTNKVTINEQKGVPHHLLGTVSPDMEFTAKDFRDSAIPLIEEIISRNHVPVLVGGTNYYIQALVSKFLLEDSTEDSDECCSNVAPGLDVESISGRDDLSHGYDLLKELDPVAANRVHPNNHRKINQYLSLHASRGVLPSKLHQENAAENWGCIDASSRFDYCLICMDAETTVLDEYVGQRVDSMVDAGLLDEVYDIYKPGADYTRGLRQSIGVREFEDFLKTYLPDTNSSANDKALKENLRKILDSPKDDKLRVMLEEAIDCVKLNTRRLLRRQKRRINRLETVFGWNIHHVDATECLLSKSEDLWDAQVVKSAAEILQSFLETETELGHDSTLRKSVERDLWSQYVCEACGNKVLRGRHEWDHHTQGRVHRKRTARFKKTQNFKNREKQQEEEEVGICRGTS